VVAPAVQVVAGNAPVGGFEIFPAKAGAILTRISWLAAVFLAGTGVLYGLRRHRLRAHPGSQTTDGTWDCGFARPSARMQYTASAFTQPLTDMLRACLGTRGTDAEITDYFPTSAEFATHTPDPTRERFFAPAFRFIARRLSPLLALQHGRIHLYVLYMAVVLIGLLLWKGGI